MSTTDDYVECEECGHPIENHGRSGCQECGGECPCRVPWTAAEIRRVRREEGLPAQWLAQYAPRI